MKILVLGSRGQLGHELCKLLESTNHQLVSFDRNGLDVCNPIQISKVLTKEKPDVVINASAFTAVDLAEEQVDKCFAVNAIAPGFIAEVCEKISSIFIHVSTDYVFDGISDHPYKEDDPVSPTCVYGLSKLAGEKEVINKCSKHIILRTSWVFGFYGNNFLKTMLRLGQKQSLVQVVDDQFGAPTSAAGLSNAIVSILEKISFGNHAWGVYHYSGHPYTSWFGFAETIFDEALKLNLLSNPISIKAISSSEYDTLVKRPKNSRLNCFKIHSNFQIHPDNWVLQMQLVMSKIATYKEK